MQTNFVREVSAVCNSASKGKTRIRLLEAGCGSSSHVEFKASVDTVGIDISREQLDRNTMMKEKILGDIQEYPLPKDEFDVVVCWWVLEHVSRPKDALANMFGAVKPDGLLVLAVPNLLSYKGIVTKFTPFWFHRLYSYAMRWKSHPFPTYLRATILPKNMIRLSQQSGFSPIYFKLFEGGTLIGRVRAWSRLIDLAFSAVTSALHALSFGKSDCLLLSECVMVLRKDGMISSA
jgi:2-polyprenyl-3-methyl-5-hydroxy-6-metoxy-1,4-benzoquinol methylase